MLMVAFQKGDSKASEQILGKYQRVIVNFIYRIVNNPSEAEEQEGFVMVALLRAVLGGAIPMSLAVSVNAQSALKQPPGKWWRDRRLIDELKLNPEQQARIESIWTESRKSLIDKKAEVDENNIDLSDILSKQVIDESAAMMAFERFHIT